jgi:DsbC/DsbD-like thiol-disulfide interchange protein
MIAMGFRIALVLALGSPAAAFAAHSDWAAARQSQVRLLLARPEADGRIEGGLEVLLEPGWHTYWRNPGETGVPPVFDFSASENVADVELRYPAPERYDDGVSVSLVYRDEVVFPLTVVPLEAGQPITLRVEARFGVCKDVCIPTRARAELTLPPVPPSDPLAEARLQRFHSRLPKAAEPGRFDVEEVPAQDDALLVEVRMPESSYSDLFVDPPSGWYIGQPEFIGRDEGVSRYRLSLAGRPSGGAPKGLIFRFVAVAGGEAIEEAVTIP